MNRQYIGARYVPKVFNNNGSNEWVSGIAYEPLTIVTYLENSYTSVKPVPSNAGSPNVATEYWACTGNVQGVIGNLDERVEAVEDEIEETNENISKVNSPTLRNMANRKFVFVGDSYTQVPTPSTSFVHLVASRLGLTANQYHNIGVSGVAMSGYISQVNNYAFDDGADITDVVVTGGINDAHVMFNNSQLSTQIPELISAIRTKFPNAIIWAGFSGNGYYTNLVESYEGFTYANVQNIKYLWERYFTDNPYVIYMDKLDEWARALGDTDFYQTGGSGLHPYNFGIIVLAEMIANYLKGGASLSPDLTAGSEYATELAIPYTNWTGSHKLGYIRIGSFEHIHIQGAGANLTEPITINNQPFNLLTQPNFETAGIITLKEIRFSTPLFYTVTGDSTLKPLMTTFSINDRYIKAHCRTAISPIQNVNSIWYPDLDFIVPANAI